MQHRAGEARDLPVKVQVVQRQKCETGEVAKVLGDFTRHAAAGEGEVLQSR